MTVHTSVRSLVGRRPPFGLSLAVTVALVALAAYLRLGLFSDRYAPFAVGAVLLAALWTRDKRLLWASAVALIGTGLAKALWLLPAQGTHDPERDLGAAMMVADILIITVVVHLLISARDRLERAALTVEHARDQFRDTNRLLEDREREVAMQNGELRAQAAELEQQTEELRQQSEELAQTAEEFERQSHELAGINRELAAREDALQTLLAAARWDGGATPGAGADGADPIRVISGAALRLLGSQTAAVGIVRRDGDLLRVQGGAGLPAAAPGGDAWPFENSFAALVMERGQTGYIEDLALRPDLMVPGAALGGGGGEGADPHPFRSLIATPLRLRGRVVGAVEGYARAPRRWTVDDFRVIEWLASQASLVLETLDLQRELDRRRREAEDESLRKTRFLAAVSHDVRTPANAINLLAELTLRTAEDPDRAADVPELARELKANAVALIELVSDMLDVARFDTGRLDLEISTFSLTELLDREVGRLRAVAAAKGLSLVLDACRDESDEPVTLRTDRMKLSRVLTNITANAIKFTTDGSVTVRCRPLATGHVEVAIADTGPGIPEDTRPRIFDEFFQLTNPARDRSKGTGLGLAICRRLADAIGCGLSVDSQVGRGTTFTITIPPALVAAPDDGAPTVSVPQPAASTGAAAAAQPPKPLAGMQILLVEDHHPTRRATARLLAAAGATVIQAETGSAAIQLLRHESPNVLLLDLMLPDIDGSEVLKSLRSRRPEALRRIFAVSGDVTEHRSAQVRQLGAEGLVAKPVNIHSLVRTLASPVPDRRTEELVGH